MTFRFLNPWLLLLYIPAILLFIVQYRRRLPALIVSSVDHFSSSKGTQKPKLGLLHLPLFLEFIGIMLFILAVARPQSGREVIMDVSNGIDITLCLDVSGSMEYFDPEKSQSMQTIVENINDGELKSRIEIAKEELIRFINKRPTDRLGVIVFATQPYQLCPLTIDKKLLTDRVKEVNTDMLGDYNQGTGLAAPLTSAIQRLKKSPAKRRVIILMTDGAHNRPQELSPVQAASLAKDFNITIYSVGIGSPSAVRISNDVLFNRRRLERAPYQFDEELMRSLASETDGKYFHVNNKERFQEVMDSIDTLEKVEIKRPRFMNFKDLFPWFLYSGALFLGISFLLNKSVFLRIP